uniref:4-hydroxy-tetrahydrodipicolinate synthase n=1 Tax=Calcidiscus leptoporus TaxID=127549 RepID=A0A7S0IND1_9EUKA|mmetsp:Transcript_14217/g.32459  ORF Transcript_14217/g.32459 Transcript_14217/m.32459 type:complete len:350 (+) Transcript_14217:31-1080(+)
MGRKRGPMLAFLQYAFLQHSAGGAFAPASAHHETLVHSHRHRTLVAALPLSSPMKAGSLVALVTPMTPDGALDLDSLRELLQWHVRSETDGIVALGTTGEASTLSMEERAAVLQVCSEEVVGKVPLMVGTGTIDPRKVIAMNEQALEYGADSCLVVTPYYTKPTQAGLLRFFRYVADATSLPLLLYNVPGRTAVDLQPHTVGELAKHPRIFGIKEATGDLARVPLLRELCGDDFMLFSGEDSNALEFTLHGGDGVISVTSNVAPAEQHLVFEAALRGDEVAAQEHNEQLKLLHQRLFLQANPIPVKWALAAAGRVPYGIRLPLCELEEPFHTPLLEAMRVAGVAVCAGL